MLLKTVEIKIFFVLLKFIPLHVRGFRFRTITSFFCRKVVLKRFCFKVSSIQVLVLFHYGPYNTVK